MNQRPHSDMLMGGRRRIVKTGDPPQGLRARERACPEFVRGYCTEQQPLLGTGGDFQFSPRPSRRRAQARAPSKFIIIFFPQREMTPLCPRESRSNNRCKRMSGGILHRSEEGRTSPECAASGSALQDTSFLTPRIGVIRRCRHALQASSPTPPRTSGRFSFPTRTTHRALWHTTAHGCPEGYP